ncbi:MAG: hypothetical protein MHPSP_003565, partial [Paramarteilia canceri]
ERNPSKAGNIIKEMMSQNKNSLESFSQTLNTSFKPAPPENINKIKKKKAPPLKNEPHPPPSNIYALFTRKAVKGFEKNLGSRERLTRVSEEWKVCPQEVKDELLEELKVMNDIYFPKLASFYASLSDPADLDVFSQRHKSKIPKIKEYLAGQKEKIE